MNILKRIWRAIKKENCMCGGLKPDINVYVLGGAEIDLAGCNYITNLTLGHGKIIVHKKEDGPLKMLTVLDKLMVSGPSEIGHKINDGPE